MLGQGTLVRVQPRTAGQVQIPTQMVEKHGALWVVDSIAMRGTEKIPTWYWCRPLANPTIYFDWREDELTVAKEEQDK